MNKNKKRRGRPWHNHPAHDQGTAELQQKRWSLVQRDPALAESLLGILYGRYLITESLYEAGRFFGELGYRFEPCLGQQFRQHSSIFTHKIVIGKGTNPAQWSDEQHQKRTQEWCHALVALKQAGSEPYKVVLRVVFYDQDLYTAPVIESLRPFMPSLRKGLEYLEVYFKEGMRDAQGKPSDPGLNPAQSTRFQPLLRGRRSLSPP